MRNPLFVLVALAFTTAALAADPPVTVEPAFPHIHLPGSLFLSYIPDGADRIVVLQQGGQVQIFDNTPDAAKPTLALDLRGRLRAGGEEGLLGLAFHPDFKKNHQVFLYFTAAEMPRHNMVTRFTLDSAAEHIDPNSQVTLLNLPHKYGNHDGGMIAFGPDGMLYVGVGDGGSGGDPDRNGQNKNVLLAKILRIDPDHPEPDRDLHYGIPKDNPFVGQPDARGEVWAYGLRNPWRFSFDRQTGDLWCGDVGQDLWEEIDVIKKGGNYGWSVYEGFHKFHPPRPIDTGPFEFPIVEHGHGEDSRCIIGGYVYRGKKIPALQGAYIYGDYTTGLIWAIRYTPGTPIPPPAPGQPPYGSTNKASQPIKPQYLGSVSGVCSFGEDRDGEIYMVSLGGSIYHFVPK